MGNGDIELYRPSNGTEGDSFINEWCADCDRHPADIESDDQCEILMATFVCGTDDTEYPDEWRYVDNSPVCTGFRSRDGGMTSRCNKTIDMFDTNSIGES